VTYGTGTHVLSATYAGDTSPIQFASSTSNPNYNLSINRAPTADDQNVSATQGVAKTITLTGSDLDGNALTFAKVTDPTNGTLGTIGTVTCTGATPNNCSANVTYTPTSG